LLDRLSIQTSIMDTDTHTFCTIQSHAIYRLKNDLFHISLVIIPRLPYRPKTKTCVNMRQMMITRMIRKLLFFNLFSVFLQLIDVKIQVGMIWRYQPIRQGWYDVVIQSMSLYVILIRVYCICKMCPILANYVLYILVTIPYIYRSVLWAIYKASYHHTR